MEFLKYFITEEIYILPQEQPSTSSTPIANEDGVDPEPETAPSLVNEKKVSADKSKDSTIAGTEPMTEVPEFAAAVIIHNTLSKEEEILLAKITSAINIPEANLQRVSTLNEVKSLKVIAFGEYPELKDYPFYEIITKGPKQLLVANNLSEITEDKMNKRKLWNALKQMFGI